MAILSTGNTFSETETVTHTKLNNIADAATFDDPVDDSTLELYTDGKLRIKDDGVSTAKILDGNVTKAKIENVADMKVLGNTSGSATAPQEVDIIDDDTMATASATTLATSESIKAYADTRALDPTREYNSFNHSTVSGTIIENTTGRPLWVSFTCSSADDINYMFLEISPNSNMSPLTRIAQSRIIGNFTFTSGAQVCGIVPSGWYWEVNYAGNGALSEQVHCSFAL
jgi:hypothetical protein